MKNRYDPVNMIALRMEVVKARLETVDKKDKQKDRDPDSQAKNINDYLFLVADGLSDSDP
jgi:hypothetical protein